MKVEPALFTNRVNQLIAKTALAYLKEYREPPGNQMEYLLEMELIRGDDGKLLRQTLEILDKQKDQIQPAFILNQLTRFVEIQSLSSSLQSAIESLGRGELEDARKAIYSSAVPEVESSGIWLHDPKKMLSWLDDEQEEFFSSGIGVLDRAKVTPARKTLVFMIAAAKKGKTWWLVQVGKSNLLYRHTVLHITLEVSEKVVARRYVQSMFSLTKSQAREIKVPYFQKTETGTAIDFQTFQREGVPSRRKEVSERLASMKGRYPRLLIKEFPTGALTTEQLDMYLDQLDKTENFRPDVIILDYPDLMKIDSAQMRIDTGRQFRDLRGIAVKRNSAMVAVTQGNREADTAKVVDKRNVAEDWSKIGTADAVYTYSQTEAEKALGLARFFVAAGRDEVDRFMVLISQSYDIGQFCIDSIMMSADIRQQLEGGAPKEVE
jgi:replicative DNA helicase